MSTGPKPRWQSARDSTETCTQANRLKNATPKKETLIKPRAIEILSTMDECSLVLFDENVKSTYYPTQEEEEEEEEEEEHSDIDSDAGHEGEVVMCSPFERVVTHEKARTLCSSCGTMMSINRVSGAIVNNTRYPVWLLLCRKCCLEWTSQKAVVTSL